MYAILRAQQMIGAQIVIDNRERIASPTLEEWGQILWRVPGLVANMPKRSYQLRGVVKSILFAAAMGHTV